MAESRPVRPWDLFNKKMGRVPVEIHDERYNICKGCEHFLKITKQCTKCGCFMHEKTKLSDAECPINKWGKFKYEEVS